MGAGAFKWILSEYNVSKGFVQKISLMCHKGMQRPWPNRPFTHFGVSVAMDDHWQRVVGCVPNSHAVRSKLEQHLVCLNIDPKARLWIQARNTGAMTMDIWNDALFFNAWDQSVKPSPAAPFRVRKIWHLWSKVMLRVCWKSEKQSTSEEECFPHLMFLLQV